MAAKLTKEIVNERIHSRGLELVGEYLGKGTKTMFSSLVCGHTWLAVPNDVMRGSDCPKCYGTPRLTVEEVKSRLSGREIEFTGEYLSAASKTTFRHLLCGNEWDARPDAVMGGSGCPYCYKNTHHNTNKINELIHHRGIVMKSEYLGNVHKKALFMCDENHTWEASVKHMLSGRGCPSCASYGYRPDKEGHLYGFSRGGYVKYGITNNITRRLEEHRRHGEFILLFSKKYSDGNVPKLIERQIKTTLGGNYATKEQCPDGYTETLDVSRLDDLLKMINT
jgi:hypothetical protein